MPFEPFNAANTLALGADLRRSDTENALRQLMLQREHDPNSYVNRAREIGLQEDEAGVNFVREQVERARIANAVPQIRSVLGAIGQIKDTISNRGVTAGRQRLAERFSFLKDNGVLPEDFEIGLDLDALSDEEFVAALAEEEQDLVSTLISIAPAPQSRTSAAIGDMQALGYPMTREGFQEYNEDRGTGTAEGLESLLAEARLMGIISDQRDRDEDRRREQREREQAQRANELAVQRNLEQSQSAVELTDRLEGTMLESGSVVPADWRRGIADLRSTFGIGDSGEFDQMIADFDSQRKLLADQVNARIASGDYGRSATQLESIQRSLANQDISPAAIIRIQGQLAQMDLDRAEANDIKIENRKKWERLAKEWKNYSPVSPKTISGMSIQQLESLDPGSLSKEEREAAADRWDELNGQ